MNFLLTKFPDPVEIISSDKNVIFVQQNLLAFKKTPLCSMKWCDQKFESKMTGPAGGGGTQFCQLPYMSGYVCCLHFQLLMVCCHVLLCRMVCFIS